MHAVAPTVNLWPVAAWSLTNFIQKESHLGASCKRQMQVVDMSEQTES